jgi:hypothetical protein
MRLFESLEDRSLFSTVTFAVIGDFGLAGAHEAAVAARVRSWNPAFVATVGDNNYENGAASTIDANIGQYYHSYISPYRGGYGAGSADGVNHFFPALGNHEWYSAGAKPHLDYFTLPGNERYYVVRQGPVQLFVLDSDSHDPDLGYVNASTSTQNSKEGQWLKSSLAASTAPWKLVLFHHSPFTSGLHGNSGWMQWPFQQWGASAVLSGHDHDYERIVRSGLPYFVDGLGGAELRPFSSSVVSGSAARYATDYGAMKVDASDTAITFRFVTLAGATIDAYTLNKTTPVPPSGTASPATPTSLTASVSTTAANAINLSWKDNATNETAYKIERSTDGTTFYPLAATGANGTFYRNTGLTPGKRYYYRVYATNPTGRSAYSNVASLFLPAAAAAAPASPSPLHVAKADDPVWA